jgi:phosphomannomutase
MLPSRADDLSRLADPEAAELMAALDYEGLRVVVRPSGTEPKVKCYMEASVDPVVGQEAVAAAVQRLLDEASSELSAVLGSRAAPGGAG